MLNTTEMHQTSTYRKVIGNIVVFYNYEAGNSLQTQHFYVDGVKKLTLPHAEFIRICDAIHADKMTQGTDTDCDKSEENEF